MQAVPNPEDIIWDDIGNETKEKDGEQASDDVVMPDNERQDSSERSTEETNVPKSLGESDPSDV